ncbi:hypothetical protein DJ70_06610 [Halorubrum halodurans]|uniref:Uncharacterized protein n=1 Tax=Halorubrum halodurans TaxID=1383851 RepID=A0A256IKX1_9EURY|nr:hypothetical protein DJ70_06610 [Halorubrum halodurans]
MIIREHVGRNARRNVGRSVVGPDRTAASDSRRDAPGFETGNAVCVADPTGPLRPLAASTAPDERSAAAPV